MTEHIEEDLAELIRRLSELQQHGLHEEAVAVAVAIRLCELTWSPTGAAEVALRLPSAR